MELWAEICESYNYNADGWKTQAGKFFMLWAALSRCNRSDNLNCYLTVTVHTPANPRCFCECSAAKVTDSGPPWVKPGSSSAKLHFLQFVCIAKRVTGHSPAGVRTVISHESPFTNNPPHLQTNCWKYPRLYAMIKKTNRSSSPILLRQQYFTKGMIR